MAKKAALKTAGIDMSGFHARPKVFDGQTPSSAAGLGESSPSLSPIGKPRPFTGVGSVMAAITREAEISQQLVGVQSRLDEANAKLAEVDGSLLVRAFDPRAIRRSQWANRAEAEFATAEFTALKEEIAQAGGNVQPIQVRPILGAGGVFDGQTPTHEIVYGHRRHRACLELGLPVQAIVQVGMDDRQLFEAMDRENRGRKNLSAWEQGRMYEAALEQGLYPSIRRLSENLGVNLSDVSRALQLAKLPQEVVAAFFSPLDLQVRWAKPLSDALQKDPEGVLARARAIAGKAGQRAPIDVFNQLIDLQHASGATEEIVIASGKKRHGILRVDAKGRTVVELDPGVVAPPQREALVAVLKSFLASRSGVSP